MCEIVLALGRNVPMPPAELALPDLLLTFEEVESPLVLSLLFFVLADGAIVRCSFC